MKHVKVIHGRVIFVREYSNKISDATIAADLHNRGIQHITEPEIKARVLMGAVDMRATQTKGINAV